MADLSVLAAVAPDAGFLAGLAQIIVLDLLLAGDNAVVIALAARNLPAHLQRRAVVFGALAAVVLRITLTAGVVTLLKVPLLQLVGGLLLLHIAWKLAVGEEEDPDVSPADSMRSAILTILMADVVMSLDNVLAIAGAAKGEEGEYLLIVLGLLISIPIVMGGATLLLSLVHRYPLIVWLGAGLVAYTGMELVFADPWVHDALPLGHWAARGVSLAVAAIMVLAAYARKRRGPRGGDPVTPVSDASTT